MKTNMQKANLDETTKKRISELEWKKDVKEPDERVSELIIDILYGENQIRERYDKMEEKERSLFNRFFEHALNSLAGYDYDKFIEKIQPLINKATKQNIKEVQHVGIANAIDKLTKEKNRFPARCEIVSETGYSLKTINVYLENYQGSFIQKGRREEISLMREKMISMCYKQGIRGDMKAARLFLEATSEKQNQAAYNKNEQNNFIQINGYTITTEQLSILPMEKQRQIQEIFLFLKKSAQ